MRGLVWWVITATGFDDALRLLLPPPMKAQRYVKGMQTAQQILQERFTVSLRMQIAVDATIN
ncbi:hypothetical protein EFV37_32650 [Mesorhizobium loti]|nr:hypothetical protein BAE38_31325 [Mesorhizobium loti]QKC66440.1 hypothetical protein EB229_32640 [Mesorhizobium jarvisii]QKD12353.1 hypothetical protein EFV37_32650 [Mesorhizobium loti]